jgi:hypothetical protein
MHEEWRGIIGSLMRHFWEVRECDGRETIAEVDVHGLPQGQEHAIHVAVHRDSFLSFHEPTIQGRCCTGDQYHEAPQLTTGANCDMPGCACVTEWDHDLPGLATESDSDMPGWVTESDDDSDKD